MEKIPCRCRVSFKGRGSREDLYLWSTFKKVKDVFDGFGSNSRNGIYSGYVFGEKRDKVFADSLYFDKNDFGTLTLFCKERDSMCRDIDFLGL